MDKYLIGLALLVIGLFSGSAWVFIPCFALAIWLFVLDDEDKAEYKRNQGNRNVNLLKENDSDLH